MWLISKNISYLESLDKIALKIFTQSARQGNDTNWQVDQGKYLNHFFLLLCAQAFGLFEKHFLSSYNETRNPSIESPLHFYESKHNNDLKVMSMTAQHTIHMTQFVTIKKHLKDAKRHKNINHFSNFFSLTYLMFNILIYIQ